MATYSRILLSGTPASGRVIPVVAVATPGTLCHTAVAGAAAWDEIYLWVTNVTNAAQTLTIEWGGVLDPGDQLVKSLSVPAFSPPIPIATGQVLNGALAVRAFSNLASTLNISGYVNRIA